MTLKVVCFDCDGVLADTISSWVLIHEHFGTGDTDMLSRFIAGEISDAEFMSDDIRQGKSVQPQIHRDELLRCYSGVKLMSGAQQVVEALRERGVASVIVSAGVDLMIGSIAKLLGVDDWAANGFQYDDDGYLLDEGVVTVPAHDKGTLIHKLARIRQLEPSELVSVGDSSMDLSMHIPGSQFIGFNPQTAAFDAGIGHQFQIAGHAAADQFQIIGMDVHDPLVVLALKHGGRRFDPPGQPFAVEGERQYRFLAQRVDGCEHTVAQLTLAFRIEAGEGEFDGRSGSPFGSQLGIEIGPGGQLAIFIASAIGLFGHVFGLDRFFRNLRLRIASVAGETARPAEGGVGDPRHSLRRLRP